jgi:hypothetical protein
VLLLTSGRRRAASFQWQRLNLCSTLSLLNAGSREAAEEQISRANSGARNDNSSTPMIAKPVARWGPRILKRCMNVKRFDSGVPSLRALYSLVAPDAWPTLLN